VQCVNFFGKTPNELVFSHYTETQLLEHLLIHEIGHVLTDRDFHCSNKNCIMRSINSIIDLTKKADYCTSCLKKIKENKSKLNKT